MNALCFMQLTDESRKQLIFAPRVLKINFQNRKMSRTQCKEFIFILKTCSKIAEKLSEPQDSFDTRCVSRRGRVAVAVHTS